MTGISERGLDALEAMKPDEIVPNAREIELYDRWSLRNYGLDDQPPQKDPTNLEFSPTRQCLFALRKQAQRSA